MATKTFPVLKVEFIVPEGFLENRTSSEAKRELGQLLYDKVIEDREGSGYPDSEVYVEAEDGGYALRS